MCMSGSDPTGWLRNCNVLSLLEADNYKYQGYLLLPSYMLTYRFLIPVLGVEV